MRIKKGDKVLVVKGKDRSKTGRVILTLPKAGKLVVENINLVKKHRKPRRQGEKGQTIEFPRPLAIANVKLICSKCGQAARVGYHLSESGKHRVCKQCKQEI